MRLGDVLLEFGVAFVAGAVFAGAVALVFYCRRPQPQTRRIRVMELVRAGKYRIFTSKPEPAIAVLDVQDAPITYVSSDEAVATVVKDETNPLKCTVRTIGPGVATVIGKADADLDQGEVREIEWTVCELEVSEAGIEAQSVSATAEGPWTDIPV
jgi:hypothetical protein